MPKRSWVSDHSWFSLQGRFLGPRLALRALNELPTELDLQSRSIVLFGKPVLQPRLVDWGGSFPYRYSGTTLPPKPCHHLVRDILKEVNSHCLGETSPELPAFNHVLINYYRDGNDGMGLHSDSEPELGEHPLIVSLSLGASRRFVLKGNRTGERHVLTLEHDSLLVMGGRTQEEFKHGLPKTKLPVGPRLNLTFRSIRHPGGGHQPASRDLQRHVSKKTPPKLT